METGLLNFHDEETFATSIYDQGDFSGVDGQSSLYDMMHSDLQYSSDYTNQSAVHWDSDQEQEHNGDLAVLPVAPSECSSLNSSKEDYNKSLFEWQDGLFTYQPLDPDVVCLDGQVIPSELPDNIFEDSFESNTSTSSSLHRPNLSGPIAIPARCSTPIPSPKETTVQSNSSHSSLNLDMSLSALDVNVSDIDVSALGINVSSLDIKAETVDLEVKPVKSTGAANQVDDKVVSLGKIVESGEMLPPPVKCGLENVEDPEFAAIFGVPQGSATEASSLPSLNGSQLPSSDVEQLHDIAMEFIKEEQEAQAWNNLPLDCNVDLDSLDAEVPVLEAGNLESLLEQFEATLKPAPEFSQSMPASPAHFSVPPSPLSMPASPLSNHSANPPTSKASPLPSPLSSPAKCKREAISPKKSSPAAKGVSLLHQNILESLPSEIMDRIKASGRKKTIPLIPAMPSKRPSKSGTRMHAAGAALSRNKLLKLVSRKSTGGENVQLDHDYCSNDSSSNIEFVPDKLVMDIQASTKQMEWDEDKSRKDSGLESGDVSEDSESAAVASNYSSGNDSSSGSRSKNSLLKPRTTGHAGRSKEMLMVSVLKKVRCDTPKSPSSQQVVVQQSKEITKTKISAPVCSTKSSVQVDTPLKSLVKPSRPVQNPVVAVKMPLKAVEAKTQSTDEVADRLKKDTVKSTMAPVKVPQPTVKPCETIVKTEPSESPQPSETLLTVEPKPAVSPKPLDQPKKRKLNFEEYRNRQRAMEQKKEDRVSSKAELPSGKKLIPDEIEATSSKDDKPVSTATIVKEEKNTDCVPHSNIESVSIKKEKDETAVCNTATSVDDKQENNLDSSLSSKLVKIKQENDTESVTEVIILEEDSNDATSKPVEEKKKQRQYRTRHMSTSSSDESPQSKPVIKSRRENPSKKAVWSPSRSRSRSISSSSSRSGSSNSSRSSSSSSSSSSNSSSRSSSSSAGSTHSSGRRRRRNTRRARRSCSRSNRSSSRSTRRSNSISSGSSRRSSLRSSRSRRRSRSRSLRRSRRDRSVSSSRSTSRGRNGRRNGWKRWGRDSSRSRGSSSLRRKRSRSRSRRGGSWSSYRSSSGSRSRSRSTCQQRHTSRSRSRSRTRARRRFCSYSSRSNSTSRSRSSRSRSYSSGCGRPQTRSRSMSRDFKRAKARRGERKERRSWRSRSPMRRNVDWSHVEKEQKRQIEERRVIYVGRIPEDTTKAELRRRFEVFGPIVDINLHFREHADNYGFVTFAYKVDAYEAVERGNDDPTQPHYELCFGGRRKFCRERYADLDGMACNKGGLGGLPHVNRGNEGNSFDDMLREVQAKLHARKKL